MMEFAGSFHSNKTVLFFGWLWLTIILNSAAAGAQIYEHTGYDSLGRKVWQSNPVEEANPEDVPESELRRFEYDVMGRLKAVVLAEVNDPLAGSEPNNPRYQFDYDKYGNVIQIRDPYDRKTRFTYNYLHKQTSRRLPDGRCEYKQYDALGRVVKSVDFAGRPARYTYNRRGLLAEKRLYGDQGRYVSNEPNAVYKFGYDALSRKRSVDVNDLDAASVSSWRWSYDGEGRVSSISAPAGTVGYGYYRRTGQRKFVRTPDVERF